jgi:hypothetical protein
VTGSPGPGVLRRLRPARAFGRRRAYPAPCPRRGQDTGTATGGSHVHCHPINGLGTRLCPCGIATVTPQTFTVASRPRLYRPGLEFPARHEGRVRAANQPESTGFRAGTRSRGVTQPVSLVYLPVSLTAPVPSGSAGTTRLCRGCSRPPRRPAAQAASSFTQPLRRPRDRGLPPPFGQTAPRGARTRRVHGRYIRSEADRRDEQRSRSLSAPRLAHAGHGLLSATRAFT